MKKVKSMLLAAVICLSTISPTHTLQVSTALKNAWINYPQTKDNITGWAVACAAIAGVGVDAYCFKYWPRTGHRPFLPLAWGALPLITYAAKDVVFAPMDYYYKCCVDALRQKINNKETLTEQDMQKAFALFKYQLEHNFYNEYLRADNALNKLMRYDYGKIDFFAHPQLNDNKEFVAMFLDNCLKEVNNTKHLYDKTLATVYTRQHPEFVTAYIQCVQDKDSFFYVDGVFADTIIQTYIQHYMQSSEIESVCTFVLKHNLPASTQSIKQYITSGFVQNAVLAQLLDKRLYITPLNDYVCSLFAQSEADAEQHQKLLQLVMQSCIDPKKHFPLALQAYDQPKHKATKEGVIQSSL